MWVMVLVEMVTYMKHNVKLWETWAQAPLVEGIRRAQERIVRGRVGETGRAVTNVRANDTTVANASIRATLSHCALVAPTW